MRKSAVVGIIVLVIILAGVGTLIFSRKAAAPETTSTQTTKTSSNTTNSASTESTNPSAATSVTIDNFAFSPANITVKKGTSVTWTNKDSATHTVTETDGQTGPSSSDLATGKTYSFTFDAVGTFKYHCSIHPEMIGTVTVTE